MSTVLRAFSSTTLSPTSDDRILEGYLAGSGPDLASREVPQDLARAPLLSLVASEDASALSESSELPEPPPHCLGPPAWNPLYSHQRRGEEIELVLHIPSTAFAVDQGKGWGYLPPCVRVPAEVGEEILRGEWTGRLRRLADHFVVLAMPPGFFQPSTPAAAVA